MVKRMLIVLVLIAVIIGALGYFKTRQIQAAMKSFSFQPPPEAVTTIVAKQDTWPSTLTSWEP